MIKKIIQALVILNFVFVAGCSDSSKEAIGETNAETEVVTIPSEAYEVTSLAQASLFLSRATFGASMEDIEALVALGSYELWIEAQFNQQASYHTKWAETYAKGISPVKDLKNNVQDWQKYSDALNFLQRDAWWDIAVLGNDQLRQRVAFALSEIFVISKYGALINYPDARMSYYDVLVDNALGNFETLLQQVTYHPAMGKYLSYLGNAKENTETGAHPDENYAREVMQLFSIGLYELNLDGSKKTDKDGKPIPTYDQADIEQMAKVFTGLSDQNDFFFSSDGSYSHHSRTEPMIAYETYHDTSEKLIMGHTIEAGGTTKGDINLALNYLFNHSNTGPVIAKNLIQRLVTSNPSNEYIEHVAFAFNDNGHGVRGDLQAVVKAILLYSAPPHNDTFGKLREPLLFVSNLFRAFSAQNAENTLYQENEPIYKYTSFNFNGTGYTQQEGALEALTVFNYFTPDDAPDSLKKVGLVAPEFELFGIGKTHELLMGLINKDGFIYDTFDITAELQLDQEKTLIENKQYDELLQRLDILLVGGNMDVTTKTAIKLYISQHSALTNDSLARHVISLVMTSPDFAIQR